MPLRKSLYRGTFSYTSVAYVLADYGIEVDQNVKRMIDAWVPGALSKTPEKQFEQEAENGPDTPGYVVDAVLKVYRRHPSDSIIRNVFQANTDGEGADSQDACLSELFYLSPARVLHIASRIPSMDKEDDSPEHGNGIASLPEALERAGGDEQMNFKPKLEAKGYFHRLVSTLQSLKRRKDPQLNALTERLRREIIYLLKQS